MISRVAEHCFWLSRYLERAENTARIIDVNQTLLLDFTVPLEQQWQPLLIISGIHDYAGPFESEIVQNFMTWEQNNPCSIAVSIGAARENARVIREVISADMWERLNYYYLWMQGPAARAMYDQQRSEFYGQIKRINQLFHGITDGTMAYEEPWQFLQLGKWLERACQTARILDAKYHMLLPNVEAVGTPIDNAHWMAILTSCSGYEPYLKHHHNPETPVAEGVAEFLLCDDTFPRSVLRCLREFRKAAHAISDRPIATPTNPVEIAISDLIRWIEERGIDSLMKSGLHEGLTYVVNTIHEIGNRVHATYFDFRPQSVGRSS